MSSTRSSAPEPEGGYPPLLSLAVHEFRTPASVVAGYLRLLQREGGDPLTDQQRKMIQEAEKSCARLVTIIAELSDISKLDSGSIALARQPVDLFALAGEVAERMHESADRDVRLEPRGPVDGARTTGDSVRLRAALDAVFRSIVREKAGPCTVVMERRHVVRDGRESAVIVVAEAVDVQAVFDGAPGVFDEKRGGLGLALPLARRVIEGHGGQLWSPVPRADEARARGSAGISIPMMESTR